LLNPHEGLAAGTLYIEITKLYRTSLIQHACLSSRDHPTITKALIYLVILRDCCFLVLQAGIIDFKYVPCFVALMSAYLLQVGTGESLVPHRHDAAHSIINKTTTPTNGGPCNLLVFLHSFGFIYVPCFKILMGAYLLEF